MENAKDDPYFCNYQTFFPHNLYNTINLSVDFRKQEDVENTTKLFQLSQEYMLNGIEQMIRQELINKTKLLMLTNDMGYAIPSLFLADEIRCEEAVNNCLRFISQNLTIHQDMRFKKYILTEEDVTTDTWTLLMENEHLRENSKIKLMGLMMKKNIKNLRNNLENCDLLDKTEAELNCISDQLMKVH